MVAIVQNNGNSMTRTRETGLVAEVAQQLVEDVTEIAMQATWQRKTNSVDFRTGNNPEEELGHAATSLVIKAGMSPLSAGTDILLGARMPRLQIPSTRDSQLDPQDPLGLESEQTIDLSRTGAGMRTRTAEIVSMALKAATAATVSGNPTNAIMMGILGIGKN